MFFISCRPWNCDILSGMKRAIRRLAALLLLAAPAAAQAQIEYTNADGSIYRYGTNAGGSITVNAYTGPPWAVVIPTNINGLRVVNIGNDAFYWNTNITSVTIPGSVTNVGHDAFELCLGLTNVTIPDSVVSIGSDAFGGAALTSIAIPASVTNLGNFAFDCLSLTAITVDPENAFYSSAGGVLFDKSGFKLLRYPQGGAGSYAIPAGVTNIGEGAFWWCIGLTSVTIPDSVANIGGNAFAYCGGLTNVTIGDGVANIVNAFSDCTNLGRIAIPGSVANIEDGFHSCARLTNVTIFGSITNMESGFAECYSLASVYFSGNAPNADPSAFEDDTNVTVYYLPGAIGWSNTLAGVPALLWNPVIQTGDGSFGARNNQFGFNITGTTNIPIAVEASTNLASPVWTPVASLTLTNGLFYFSERLQGNRSSRFYRVSSP